MSKSKFSVRVQNSKGEISWTTRRGARRMVDQGIAFELPCGSLAMKDREDWWAPGEFAEAERPKLNVIEFHRPFQECWLNQEAAVLRFPKAA